MSSSSPHRRWNALSGEWVLVSPQRTQRPWQGRNESAPTTARPDYDPTCYLCPGNQRASGHYNPRYTETYVFPNDFPALLPPGTLLPETVPAGRLPQGMAPPGSRPTAAEAVRSPSTASPSADSPSADSSLAAASIVASSSSPSTDMPDLLKQEPVTGECRVICYSPNHRLSLGGLTDEGVLAVVRTWRAQFEELDARPDLAYNLIFENRGEMMGASNPHPHGQIWSTSIVPNEAQAESDQQSAWLHRHGEPLLSTYLRTELAASERVVLQNEHWAALVPWWAIWPFEVLVLPKGRPSSFIDLSAAEQRHLASILGELTLLYDRLFNAPFPYSMGWHGRPSDGKAHPEWTLHAHFYPPLLRSASIRKYQVGFEMFGMPQRDITPEEGARRLRDALQS